MAYGRTSSAGDSRQGFQVEHKNLLSAYDRLEDKSNSESEWTDDPAPRRARKAIPRPSSARGWILLVLVVAAASSLGVALGYLMRRLNITECVYMTSSYCECFIVLIRIPR